MKKSNGITLVALVVTIIVLLILASVSINLVLGENGIITRGKQAQVNTRISSIEEARDLWFSEKAVNNSLKEENTTTLDDFLDDLKSKGLIDDSEKNSVLNSADCSMTINDKKIYLKNIKEMIRDGYIEPGDVINYQAEDGKTYTSLADKNGSSNQSFTSSSELEWKVWGIDEKTGGIMIVPSHPIKRTDGEQFILKGFAGYNYGIDELNNISKIYGTGKNAIGARSIVNEDIEKLFGITEERKLELYQNYGKTITASNGTWYDGTTLSASNSKTVTSNYYWYTWDDDGIPSKDSTKLYDLVFIDDNDDSAYLVATQSMWANRDFNFSLFQVGWGDFDEAYMNDTKNNSYDYAWSVRPVVILDPNITLGDL